jgi:hypothetical protein
MAVTLASFKAAFPEFVDAGDPLLQSKLDEAVLQIDASVWGAKADLGVSYLAAHLLALAPSGKAARLNAWDDRTTYGEQFIRMQRSVCSGFRVA